MSLSEAFLRNPGTYFTYQDVRDGFYAVLAAVKLFVFTEEDGCNVRVCVWLLPR